MEDLPEELLSSILSRLSLKDLLRTRPTCRRWNTLISSNRYFGEEHARRKKYGSDMGIIMNIFGCGLYMVPYDSLLNGRPYLDNFSWNGKPYDSGSYVVVGCCNGLVCLHQPDGEMTKALVWNPATREIWKFRDAVPLSDSYYLIFGFGYDDWSDDYKILTIQPGVGRLKSLKSNFVKSIPHNAFPWETETESGLLNPCGVYLKGHLHWSLLNSDYSLLSFDLKEDVFPRTLLLPEALTAAPSWLSLGVLDDCLCVYLQLLGHSSHEVWVMKEYGVRSSWTRLFRSDKLPLCLTPVVSMPDGKVMFSGDTPCFTVYDPREDTTQSMTYSDELSGWEEEVGFFCFPWAYKESLISPRALFSVEDMSRVKKLFGLPDPSRFKRTSGVKFILDTSAGPRTLDCDSLLNGQPWGHRVSWMGKSHEIHKVVGSCNGLVLLQDYHISCSWLWNPTTKYVNKIPDKAPCLCHRFIADGFGYDHLSDDYKIVMIHQKDCHPRIAHIYCLKQDTWKTIPAPNPAREIHGRIFGVHLNGVLHWPAINADGSIMSFELCKEIFPSTLLLPETTIETTNSLGVGVIGNCLGICMPCVNQSFYEVWMMKEYGVQSSWTIVFKTGGLTKPLTPLAVTQDGKIILDDDGVYFHVYDPTNGSLSRKPYSENLWDCVPWIYQETLVSPHTLE